MSATMLVSKIFKTPLIKKSHEMNLELQNYENSSIIFNNNKVSSLKKFYTEQNYRILYIVVQHLSQHNL
jgi:hypothetical protein